ncbi:hypothetical protein [Bacillus sp. FJAT-45037]|uniref:hypothetical protein n=1 Tax=Bacillus sp. FJAT-45037 TaxID=2011007 RepID=UPI000C23C15E|nr:hypothetical protein [Bacillus sp. FJAT-45037]
MIKELKSLFLCFFVFLVVCYSLVTYLGYQMIETRTDRVMSLQEEIIVKHEAGQSVTSELRQYNVERHTLENQHRLLYTWYFKYVFDYPHLPPIYWDRHQTELIIE